MKKSEKEKLFQVILDTEEARDRAYKTYADYDCDPEKDGPARKDAKKALCVQYEAKYESMTPLFRILENLDLVRDYYLWKEDLPAK